MIESRNALPIRRVMIHNPDFTRSPILGRFFDYRAAFSHGWFEEDRYLQNVYLHQKEFYVRFNYDPLPITLIGGLQHSAMWGGKNDRLGQLPNSFDDYLRIVTGRSADADGSAPVPELENRLGNHLLNYDFGIEYKGLNFVVRVTKSWYLEDTGSRITRSFKDGIWGLNLTFNERLGGILERITYEHIYTIKQQAKPNWVRGKANYYSHGIYRDGWSSAERVIGNSLIIFDPITNRISNNMITGHHMGFSGQLSQLVSFTGLFTYSRNYGTYPDRRIEGATIPEVDQWDRQLYESREGFRQDNFSMLTRLDYSLSAVPVSLTVALATDFGTFRGHNYGFQFGIIWNRGIL